MDRMEAKAQWERLEVKEMTATKVQLVCKVTRVTQERVGMMEMKAIGECRATQVQLGSLVPRGQKEGLGFLVALESRGVLVYLVSVDVMASMVNLVQM